MDWIKLSDAVLQGSQITRKEALSILQTPDTDLLPLLQGAFQLRRHFFGRSVNLHILQNAKQGRCSENCSFCSQSSKNFTDTTHYPLQSVEELLEGARAAKKRKAVKYCMVTATRGPSELQVQTICDAAKKIKKEMNIQLCASLGLLTREKALQLAEAGIDRFNHNLETSKQFYPKVCDTHTYHDRLDTLKHAKYAGLEICSGGIMGMGETLNDRVDLALTLRELETESIPVNFLDPRPGTPLESIKNLTPIECLKTLAMFRYVNPSRDIRAAGGREACLKHLQALALYPANSIFTVGYLTTSGQGYEKDLQMIEDAGFHLGEL